MSWWARYWQENFRRSFYATDRPEAVIVVIALLVTAGLASALALGLVKTSDVAKWNLNAQVGLGLAAWFVFLMTIVTPMRMWIAKTKYLQELTTPQLRLTIDESQEGHDEYSYWYRLKAENLCAKSLTDCYARITLFRQLYPVYVADPAPRFPQPGHRLPWARPTGEGGTRYRTDFVGRGVDYVDLGNTRDQNPTKLRIPSPPRNEPQPLITDYLVEPGLYRIDVKVGTYGQPEFAPTAKQLLVRYQGGHDVVVGEFQEAPV